MLNLVVEILALGIICGMGVSVFWGFHKLFGRYAIDKEKK